MNPFPGLRPFRAEEEYLFFGREKQVDAMVDKLAETHFLAVVGTSGSGKSSLVNCGLRPALHLGLIAGAGTAWRIAQFRPGSSPIRAMAEALAMEGVLYRSAPPGRFSLAEVIETSLRMSKMGLVDAFEQARLEPGVNLLVVADQFEELFRYHKVGGSHGQTDFGLGEEATAFVNLLLEVREHSSARLYVVLTMRSDFLGDCAQFSGLPEAINTGQYLVPRMSRDERRLAIEGPVGVGGAQIAPVLLTRLVNDVGDNPDQLSILQHALNRTWASWEKEGAGPGPIELRHYEAVGTMANALDQHAEEAFGQLVGGDQQRICEKIFKALTDMGTDSRGIRRPTRLSALCGISGATEAAVTHVIDVFRDPSRSFLMPPAAEPLRAETVIDISHESLMRVWERLKGWTEEEARSASNFRRLAETAELRSAGKANLLRDPELQLALDWQAHERPNEAWAAQYRPDLGPAMQFLRESAAARGAELAAERRKRLRWRWTIGGIMVAMLATGGWLYRLERMATENAVEARRNADRAERSEAKAKQSEAGERESARIALVAQGEAEKKQAEANRSADAARRSAIAAEKEKKKAKDAEDLANTARDQSRSKELAALAEATMNEDPELAVLLALEGLQRADTSQARTQLLAAAQYAWPSAVLDAKALGGKPDAVSLSPDGSQLAVLAGEESPARRGDRTITLWDVSSRSPSIVWRKEVNASSSLAFSPDQKLLAVVSTASIHLRDAKTGDIVRSVRPEGDVGAIAFSPEGRWLAWAQKDGIRLLDYRNELAEVVRAMAKDVALDVVSFAVVADGNRIIAVTDSPLMAHRLDRQPDGNWAHTELPSLACMTPQSVSPGAQYVSATWKAQACAARTTDRTAFSPRSGTAEATSDIVWSAAGHAFAEILLSRDIIVGGSDRFETQSGSRIKGTNSDENEGDKARSISMSEGATRVALIDRRQLVRVYSIADHKPFLSRFDAGSVAVAPDGSWIAAAKRRLPGEKGATIDVIPIEHAFAPDYRSRIRRRIEVPALPEQMYAAQGSVVAVLATEPVTTVAFDAVTGTPRFDPEKGKAQVLGAARELLLFNNQPRRVVKARDGSRLAPWEQLSAADKPPVFLVSPGKEALAVMRLQAASTAQATAIVYSVRGDSLVPSGQVIGLPAALLSSPSRLHLAADARSITEDRRASGGQVEKFVWRVTSGGEPASARPARAVEATVASLSPSGRFEMQVDSEAGADGSAFKVLRRSDSFILKRFRGEDLRHRFSSDDRWLAVWSEEGIQVVDLARGDIALDLNLGNVENVDFEARNTILNVQVSDGTTLVPLDRDLVERFARWLVPRGLTPQERCRYELGRQEECRKGVVAGRAQAPSRYGPATKAPH